MLYGFMSDLLILWFSNHPITKSRDLRRSLASRVFPHFPRQHFLEGPFDAVHGLAHHLNVLFALLAIYMERDHLQGIADVVVHFGDCVQTLADEVPTLAFSTHRLPEKGACHRAGESVRDRHQVIAWDAFMNQHTVEGESHQRNDDCD